MNIDLQGNIYISNNTGYLYSFSKEGELNWKVNYGGGLFPKSVSITPDGNSVFVVGSDRKIYVLDINGNIKREFGCIGIDRQPLLVDNSSNIYFIPGCQPPAKLISMDSTGQINWEYTLDSNTLFDESSPALDYQGNIYYTYLVDSGNVKYSRIESVDYYGNYRWTYQFEQPDEWIVMPLVCDKNGTVYCGSTNGYYYYAVSTEGELLWKISLNGYYVENSTALSSDGTLYIGTCKSSTYTQGINTLIAIKDTGAVSVNESNTKLLDYSLSQNFPNPFNPATTISYQIKEGGLVQLKVYDILGKEVETLVKEEQTQGNYSVKFDGSNLPSGVYTYSLRVNNFIQNRKMILLK